MRRVPLDFVSGRTGAGDWAMVRDLCGEDEESVEAADTAQAIALIDRLLVSVPGAAIGPGDAASLTASDRDRLLAAVLQAEFGARVDCTVRCEACGEPFDIDFMLPELMAALGVGAGRPAPADGVLALGDGRRVRLPNGADELAVAGLPPDEAPAALLALCAVEGAFSTGEDPAVLEAMERVAPIVDADLDAVCPECGAASVVHFDLQHYVLAAIAEEAPERIAEIHRLAQSYGWSLGDILALRRSRRRAFAQAIDRERGAAAFEP